MTDLITLAQQRTWEALQRKAHTQPRANESRKARELKQWVHEQLKQERKCWEKVA